MDLKLLHTPYGVVVVMAVVAADMLHIRPCRPFMIFDIYE